jgi:hypothetical protein
MSRLQASTKTDGIDGFEESAITEWKKIPTTVNGGSKLGTPGI